MRRDAVVAAISMHYITTCSSQLPDASSFKPNTFNVVTVSNETGATCGLGTDYDFFVRVPETGLNTEDLVLEFSGGGGCWNYHTCTKKAEGSVFGREAMDFWFTESILAMVGSAYGNEVTGCQVPIISDGLLDFCREDHPGKTWTWVSLTYCTGDLHMGNASATYTDGNGNSSTVQHRGAVNVDVVVKWVQRNFPNLRRIQLMGASAGGWGAMAWAHVVAELYPSAQIIVWADSALHLVCPSATCDSMLPIIDERWHMTGPLVRPSWSQYWTPEAFRAGGWKLGDFLAETLRRYEGRMTLGVFTRSDDASQIRFWYEFGGDTSMYTSMVLDQVRGMEAAMPPELFRTYIASGTSHSINWNNEFWTMTYGGTSILSWMTNLTQCDVPVAKARIWDPLVGEPAAYTGTGFQTCSTTTTSTTRIEIEMSASFRRHQHLLVALLVVMAAQCLPAHLAEIASKHPTLNAPLQT